MYSPESIDSALEFSNFQNNYEFEDSLFNDIGLDTAKVDSFHLDNGLQSDDPADTFCNDADTSGAQPSTFNYTSYTTTTELSSSLGMEKMEPLNLHISQEENRKRYPVGDSNSKNAIAARDNRLKKKKYIAELEDTVNTLRADNEFLSNEVTENRSRLSALESEVQYLKSVIANQSALSAILNSVSKTPGISLSTSFGNGAEVKSRASRTTTGAILKFNNSPKVKQALKSSSNVRNLRSRANLRSKSSKDKGVQSMTAREIVQCCKERKRKLDVIHVTDSDNSDTDSEVEEIDVMDDLPHHKANSPLLQEDYGGVCLHVSGAKVSLEFCASCNKKSNNVSLDHSYSSYLSN